MANNKKLSFDHDEDDDGNSSEDENKPRVGTLGSVIETSKPHIPEVKLDKPIEKVEPKSERVDDGSLSDDNVESGFTKDQTNDLKEKRLREIREQIQAIKQQIENQAELQTLSERRKTAEGCDNKDAGLNPDSSNKPDGTKVSRKNKNRERETVELVTDFRKRMKEASKSIKKPCRSMTPSDDDLEANPDLLALADSDDWLTHKFEAKDDSSQRLAKDANTKDDTWHPIDDPRNSMNRRKEVSVIPSSRNGSRSSSNHRSHGDSRHHARHR